MPERRLFLLPKGRRLRPSWVAASAVAHALLIVVLSRSFGWRVPEPRQTLHYLLEITPAVTVLRQVEIPPPAPPPPARRGRPLVLVVGPTLPEVTAPLASPSLEPPGQPDGVPGGRGTGLFPPLAGLTVDPRLAVRPMYIPEGGGRPISMDSVVRARLLALADSLQANPGSPNGPPTWTFERNGQKYGLDGSGLHLGPITIPSALLAFLPVPQGNIDQARANAALSLMRADLLRAAAMAQNEDDLRKAARDIRERRDRERREQRERERRERERAVP